MPDQKISQLSSGTNAQAGDLFVIARGASNFNLTTAQLFNAPSATATLGGLNVDSGTLFVDATNNRVGVGTTTPGSSLDVNGSIRTQIAGGGTGRFLEIGTDGSGTTRFFNNYSAGGDFGFAWRIGALDRLTLDASGNLGLGVTPSGWDGTIPAYVFGTSAKGSLSYAGGAASLGENFYRDSGGFKYVSTGAVSLYQATAGTHAWYTAASGTAGNAITFTQAMTLDASGNLAVGSPYVVNGRVGTDGTFSSMDAKRQYVTMGMASDVATFKTDWYSGAGGTTPAMAFLTGTTERARITAAGSVVAGGSVALATTATDGFLYVPTCAGTPTGTPTAITGMAPIVVDTTNNKLYFYSNAAWRDAGP